MTTEIYRPVPGFRPSTPAVTSETITDVLTEYPVVVIHFWAEWNGVDVPMDSNIQKIKMEFEEQVHFVSCDIDLPGNIALCRRCNVVNVSFLAVFVDGQQKHGIMGLRTTDELVAEIENRLRDL